MGKRIDLVKKLQKEMNRRTEIENVAVQLISEGKCEEATALLSSLDDNVVKENLLIGKEWIGFLTVQSIFGSILLSFERFEKEDFYA